MGREKVGFALLLLGVIFAAPGDSFFWFIGLFLGLIGFVLVLIGDKKQR